jgi:hypothetical protein
MATDRQIAANRRNAGKSTGPRTRAGKKRASRNSYRHGLSYGVAGAAAFAKHIEALAQKIAGRGADVITLEIARSVAGAKFELAQIRRVKVALIARMSEFGEFEVSNPLGTFRQIKAHSQFDRQGPAIELIRSGAAKHAFFRTGALNRCHAQGSARIGQA